MRDKLALFEYGLAIFVTGILLSAGLILCFHGSRRASGFLSVAVAPFVGWLNFRFLRANRPRRPGPPADQTPRDGDRERASDPSAPPGA